MAEHTPKTIVIDGSTLPRLPWHIHERRRTRIESDEIGVTVADCGRRASATYICRASNAHDELVAALEAIVDSYLFVVGGPHHYPKLLLKRARAALAKAKGESDE